MVAYFFLLKRHFMLAVRLGKGPGIMGPYDLVALVVWALGWSLMLMRALGLMGPGV